MPMTKENFFNHILKKCRGTDNWFQAGPSLNSCLWERSCEDGNRPSPFITAGADFTKTCVIAEVYLRHILWRTNIQCSIVMQYFSSATNKSDATCARFREICLCTFIIFFKFVLDKPWLRLCFWAALRASNPLIYHYSAEKANVWRDRGQGGEIISVCVFLLQLVLNR